MPAHKITAKIFSAKKRKDLIFMPLQTTDMSLVPNGQLEPLDMISGFLVRHGFFNTFGATIIPGGVNFTIQSHKAYS